MKHLLTTALIVLLLTACAPAEKQPEKAKNPLAATEGQEDALYANDRDYCNTQPDPWRCLEELGWSIPDAN